MNTANFDYSPEELARMEALPKRAPCGCDTRFQGCFSPNHPLPEVKDVPIGTPKLSHANAAQRRFDERYISSLEIAERMRVSRPAVLHARTTGKLPEPICVNGGQIYIWERAEVEPFLAAWEVSVKLRRGEQVVVQTGPGPTHPAFPFHQPVTEQ